MPNLASDLDEAVNLAWEAAQQRARGALFNGRIFCADRISPHGIEGHWTEFRRLIAQIADPALYPRLGVRALAVNGAVLGPEGVALGRRPARAMYQADLWQLAPAGSVDPGAVRPDGAIDIMRQAATELREEVGLDFAAIHTAAPICLVEHAVSHVCDLGVALHTDLPAAAILAAHRARGDGEYGTLHVVPRAGLAAFVAEAGPAMAPQSALFLARLGWLDAYPAWLPAMVAAKGGAESEAGGALR